MRKLMFTLALLVPATAGAATTQSEQLTITASKRVVVYGERVRVSGVLGSRSANAPVIIAIRRHGEPSFLPVSTTTTGANGVWSFTFEPTVRSLVQARSGDSVSRAATIRVKPRLTLTRRRGALFAQAVSAGSFRGRHVWFQRRSKEGRWASVRKVILNDPPRRFEANFPRGVSRVRISLARRQTVPGYEPTVSRVLVFRSPLGPS